MTPRRQRMLTVGVILAGVAIAVGFALRAFRENLMMFYAPTQVASGEAPIGHPFRLGGLVTIGSVERVPGQLDVSFVLTDLKHDIKVAYSGILPDLFREGQGIIAHGTLGSDGVFHADEVLAKHDESYTPPEVAGALKAAREDPGPQQ
jgi:cytochrome c-type biogenesis protein CcmE